MDNSCLVTCCTEERGVHPSLGWKTYFSEPAVCELISDLGKPLHQGILLETATDIHDVTPEKIAALAQELADRGVEDTLYRGA